MLADGEQLRYIKRYLLGLPDVAFAPCGNAELDAMAQALDALFQTS